MNNFEPNWSDIPQWANYAVYDCLGTLHVCDHEPVPKYEEGYWVPSVVGGKWQIHIIGAIQSYMWHDVIYQRPQ